MTARPVLVLVHGTRFDGRQWQGYDALVPGADVVLVDLPGHGTRTGEAYTTDAAVAVVAEAIDAAPPGAPIVLAGHSLGGYVATTYAERHPGRLAALVVIGACADPTRHRLLRRLYSGFAAALPVVGPARMSGVMNRVLRALGADPALLPDETAYAVLPAAWAATAAGAGAHQMRSLQHPVFLVAGQFDQLGIDIRRYARACRDPHVRIIPRATHLAPLTHRSQVAAVLTDAAALARD
ncbi:MAG: alpha/beta hydrolase [Mobilicoccus sp.]|nr:alpha/beta hydrolase [Mobilicoccus sp.]